MSKEFFDNLQAEIVPWVAHNFPGQPAWHALLGIVEELGELDEASAAQDEDALRDAIGDAAIFLANYCSTMGISAGDVFEASVLVPEDLEENVTYGLRSVARLCKSHLKLVQGIRGSAEEHRAAIKSWLAAVLNELSWTAELSGLDLVGVVRETWSRVVLRDWRANPKDGSVEVETCSAWGCQENDPCPVHGSNARASV